MTILKLKIRCSTGEDYSIEIEDSKTVLELKNEIEKQFNVPSSSQRLIYRGRILQDDKTCNEYGIQTEQTVHMVKAKTATSNTPSSTPAAAAQPAATPAGPAQPSTTTPPTNPPTSNPSQPPFVPPFGFGANPFGIPMPPPGTDPFSPANLQAQAQQMMQNPEMVRNMMQNPMVQSMLNNPEFMRNMMQQNPQMREILERNPEINQVINNPELMRQTMELMSNPYAFQEMMRSQDQAINNLTSMDGGYDALRRMYHDIQEPMQNAADSMHRTATPTSVPSQPSSTLYNDAVPNPWGGSSSSTGGTTATGGATGIGVGTNPYLANMMNMFGGATSTPPATATTPATTATPAATGTTPTTPTSTPPAPSTASTSTPPASAAPAADGSTSTSQPPPPLPGMPNMADPSMLQSMLSNPMMASMMQSMMNDPNTIETIININPQIRNNPMLCNMLRNPEMRNMILNPQTIQAALQMQQQMGGINPAAATAAGGAAGAGVPGINPFMNSMFMQPPPASTLPPREQYATQLEELKSMGFFDEEENLRILQACHGNINLAVDRLLQN